MKKFIRKSEKLDTTCNEVMMDFSNRPGEWKDVQHAIFCRGIDQMHSRGIQFRAEDGSVMTAEIIKSEVEFVPLTKEQFLASVDPIVETSDKNPEK